MSIREEFFKNKEQASLWDVAVSIQRGNPLPLDSNSVFESYSALEEYAAGPLAYPGQIVSVVKTDGVEFYGLDHELKIVALISSTSNNNVLELYGGSATDNIVLEEEIND